MVEHLSSPGSFADFSAQNSGIQLGATSPRDVLEQYSAALGHHRRRIAESVGVEPATLHILGRQAILDRMPGCAERPYHHPDSPIYQ